MLSKKRNKRLASYKDFVSLDESEKTERFYSLKRLPSVMGGNTFQNWVKGKFKHMRFSEEIPESRRLAPSTQEIIAAVCHYFQVPEEQIFSSRRGHENLPRNTALYLLRVLSRKTMPEIANQFKVSNSSTIGSVIARMKSREATDRHFRKYREEISVLLYKSQERT